MPAVDTKRKQRPIAAKPAEKPKPVPKKNPAPKKVAKSKEKVVDSSDEGESLGETTGVVSMEKSSTEGTSESESESESQEESEDETAVKSSERVYNYKYKPPPSFKAIPPSNSSHNPFSAKNLNGKELWFITTPYAAPLNKIDVINPADIAEGLPVLQTSSGRSYCLRAKDEHEEAEGIRVFAEDGRGEYRIAGKQITKSFQMIQSLPIAKEVTADMIPKNKPVSEQPEGLRMRFKPIGFEGELEQDGNVEREHKKKKYKSHNDGEKKKHLRKSKSGVGV